MLNAEQIIERGLLKLEHSKGKVAQVGYDLSVKEIKKFKSGIPGQVLKDKTMLREFEILEPIDGGWMLPPSYYEVTFWEGCKIPNNHVGLIRQRSSMLRNGSLLHSSVFDPGFETEFMGSFIAVFCPIFIEKDARIGQIYFHSCEPVSKDKLYGGKEHNSQFQNDKQRK